QGRDHPLLYRREVEAQELHWISGSPPAMSALARLGAKTRYRMPDASCGVELRERDACCAMFAEPQWAPTPGQYLVLYGGDLGVGGGVIATPPDAAARSTKTETRVAV